MKKKEYKIILLHGSILFITFIVKHKKLMRFIWFLTNYLGSQVCMEIRVLSL